MFKSLRNRAPILFISIIFTFTLAGCGNRDPYGIGWNQFYNEVSSQISQPTSSEWTVYVAHGTATTGWLWFRKQNPVVWMEVEYRGISRINNVVIQAGEKTVKSDADYDPGAGIGFYLKSSRIPQTMGIAWKANGQHHQLELEAKSMVELPSVNVSS